MEKKDHVLLGAALTVGAVEGWLDEHVDPESGYVVDDTLAIEGAAADSKATGDAIAAVEAEIPAVDNTLSTAGAAADAKKTGDEIADLESALTQTEETVIDIAGEPSITIDLSTVALAGLYDSGGTWLKNNANQDGKVVECLPGRLYSVTANANGNAVFSFVKSLPAAHGDAVSYAGTTSRNVLSAGTTAVLEAPSDAVYVWFATKSYANNLTPASIVVLGESGRIDELEKSIDGGGRQNILTWVWENGGIGDDGLMLPAKRETDFFRCLRTRNYLKLEGFDYTAVADRTLTVFEYSNTFAFIRKKTVTGNYTLAKDAFYVKLQLFENDTSNEVSVSVEQGGLDGTGEEEPSTTRVRTGWLDIENLPFDSIWFRGIAYARVYDSGKVILQNGTSYARYNQNKGGFCKISSLLEILDTESLFGIKSTAKYLRIAFSDENASTTITPQTFNIRFTFGDGAYIAEPAVYVSKFEEIKNTYVDANTMSFSFRLHLMNGHQVSASEATSSSNLLDNGQYFTSLMLLLPPNYKPTGKPSKLIMWCHGSGDYSLMGYDVMSNNYMDYLGYWQKEGFAIADMFVRTSKYGSMGGDINGMPTNTAAYEQGYKWLMEHFNLDDNGCYVSAKSMGGVGALNILYSSIPLKAMDLLAPALNPFYQQCGYGIPSRADFIDDLKLVDADALLEDPSPASPMSTNDFNNLMIANADKLVGYNCYFSHVVNKTFAELVVLKFKNPGTYDDVIKLAKCPVRIHIAVDDTTVAYNQSLNLIKAIKNGNGIAEIRSMPSGCASPHHAVDNDPDALKVASIVTALGYTCTNVPLAYAEAASWFKYYD